MEVTGIKIKFSKGSNKHVAKDLINNASYMLVINGNSDDKMLLTKSTVTAQKFHIFL